MAIHASAAMGSNSPYNRLDDNFSKLAITCLATTHSSSERGMVHCREREEGEEIRDGDAGEENPEAADAGHKLRGGLLGTLVESHQLLDGREAVGRGGGIECRQEVVEHLNALLGEDVVVDVGVHAVARKVTKHVVVDATAEVLGARLSGGPVGDGGEGEEGVGFVAFDDGEHEGEGL